jgi:hypothetical protein
VGAASGGFDTRLGRARGETFENGNRDGDRENQKIREPKNQRTHKDSERRIYGIL